MTIGTIGEVAVRSFPATAAQKLTLTVSGNSIAGADITVRDPKRQHRRDTVRLGSDRVPRRVHAAHDGHLHDHGGSTRRADGFADLHDERGAGQHRLDRDRHADDVTIGTIGEVAVRTFTATAGQSVTLSVAGNTIPGVDLTVRNPSGGIVATLFASGATATRSAFTLPVTGTYTITVDPRDQLVGTLTFTLVQN